MSTTPITYTINLSNPAGAFTVVRSNGNVVYEGYTSNVDRLYDTAKQSLTLLNASTGKVIMPDTVFGSVYDGYTNQAFSSFAALMSYIKTNFIPGAGTSTGILPSDYNDKVQKLATANALLVTIQAQLDTANATVVTDAQQISDLTDQVANLQAQIDALLNQNHTLDPIVGYNVHFFNSPIYVDIDDTIAKAKAEGATHLRCDVYVDNTGLCTSHSTLLSVISKCNAAGLVFMPMLNIDLGDVQVGPTRGTAIGTGWQNNYHLPYTECGNEMAARNWAASGDPVKRCIQSGDGMVASNYDQPFMAQIGATTKAMVLAIKAVDPTAKVFLNGEWYHTYFMQYMINTLAIPVDLLAWHFYTDQWTTYGSRTRIDTLLKSLFPTLPLIFNEVGVRPSSTGVITTQNVTDYLNMVTVFKPYGVVIYELFDQSERSGSEAFYGIYNSSKVLKSYAPQLVTLLTS